MKDNVNKGRLLYPDILRVVAIICVVNMHATAPLLYETTSVNSGIWWVGNIFDSISRWSVPVFIMISGMFLLNPSKNETTADFMKKRFAKIIIPLIFWSFTFTLWKMKHGILHEKGYVIYAGKFFTELLSGSGYYHLWFVYMMLGLYIVTPVLRIFLKNAEDKDIIYFLGSWFVVNSIFGIIHKIFKVNIGITAESLNGFIGYYVGGYFLSKVEIPKMKRIAIYIAGLFCLVMIPFFTYKLTIANKGVIDEYFYSYLSINTVIISAAIFLLFKNINWTSIISENSPLCNWVTILSSASFGVYLMHPMVMETLSRVGIDYKFIHPAAGIPLTLAATIVISFCITRLMQKIPYIKSLV